jgi:hypothetical protein
VILPRSTVADFLTKDSTSNLADLAPWDYEARKPSFDPVNLFTYFEELLQAEPGDASHAISIEKVCQKVLSRPADFAPFIVNRAAELAIQLSSLDALEIAVSQQDLSPETVQKIRQHLSTVTPDEFKKV